MTASVGHNGAFFVLPFRSGKTAQLRRVLALEPLLSVWPLLVAGL
jgi:hypothetical protein